MTFRLGKLFEFGGFTARGHVARRWALTALIALLTAFQTSEARCAHRLQKPRQLSSLSALLGPRLTTATDWWSSGVFTGSVFRLDLSRDSAGLFRLFQLSTQSSGWQSWSAKGPSFSDKIRWVTDLYWHVDAYEVPSLDEPKPEAKWLPTEKLFDLIDSFAPSGLPFESLLGTSSLGLRPLLTAPKPEFAPVAALTACPSRRRPRKITFYGLSGEGDTFALVDCEGVVSADAIDRLSVLGRQPGTSPPSLPLPMSPASNPQVAGEWLDGVRLLHPRLLGLIQQIALAFPFRAMAVYSGYRRDARPSSRHLRGRAVDIAVNGIATERLYAFCRTLRDAGCGYYPNQPFVHVDVREPTLGSATWVDVSHPGQASVYVKSMPRVVAADAQDSPDAE
jgi:hypothetical protein